MGRGTAPVKFDVASLGKKMGAPQKAEPRKPGTTAPQKDTTTVKDKTKLDFYEALKEDKEDTKLSVRPKPKAIERPAEKAAAPLKKTKDTKPSEPPQQKAPSKKQVVAKTNTTGPTYTIQAASVRNAG